MLVPNATCELEAWSVVHVIVAEEVVKLFAATAVMTGIDGGVVKVKLAEVDVPAESVEMAA
jgi:hypothetical protein